MVLEISDRLILHWNYRGYSCLPEELCSCGSHVCELYLKYNNITQLPDWIRTMTNLTSIYLQANSITELPEGMKFLVNLEILDVSQNCLSSIPSSVGCLNLLKRLVLTGNQIVNLPDSIGKLKNLTSLQISSNKLKDLPYSLHRCLNIQEIYADSNQLTVLPNFLTRLPHLSTLSVCSNRLKHLPNLPFIAIERFHCDGNMDLGLLPYPLSCQWNRTPTNPLATLNTLHISCYGSFFLQPSALSVPKDKRSDLPPDIAALLSVKRTPPNLSELAIRSMIRSVFEPPMSVQFNSKNNLHMFLPHHHNVGKTKLIYHVAYDRWVSRLRIPATLIRLLQNGPQAFCFHCLDAIFSSADVALLPKVLVLREQLIQPVVCSIWFCSSDCFDKCVEGSSENKSLLNTRLR